MVERPDRNSTKWAADLRERLNACDSAPQAEAIVSVIDCAVGMSDEIDDSAAIAFAAAFYEALGYGRSRTRSTWPLSNSPPRARTGLWPDCT
jgi:hypothetical protein